jgi:hypothetical protein
VSETLIIALLGIAGTLLSGKKLSVFHHSGRFCSTLGGSMEFDQSIIWKRGHLTLTALLPGVFPTFHTEKLVHYKQDKGGTYERIYTQPAAVGEGAG